MRVRNDKVFTELGSLTELDQEYLAGLPKFWDQKHHLRANVGARPIHM